MLFIHMLQTAQISKEKKDHQKNMYRSLIIFGKTLRKRMISVKDHKSLFHKEENFDTPAGPFASWGQPRGPAQPLGLPNRHSWV